ncbi:MAG: ArsR/SmtB family transcription factor [Candidatus Hodarchaeales archaeon]|jgi:ArsR family transcriptional regulator
MAACTSIEPHPEKIAEAREKLFEKDSHTLSDFFKILSGETRVRILLAITEIELCVCDLAEVLKTSVSAVSHQLRRLKESRLVKSRREGKIVYYTLADDHVRKILEETWDHLLEIGPLED